MKLTVRGQLTESINYCARFLRKLRALPHCTFFRRSRECSGAILSLQPEKIQCWKGHEAIAPELAPAHLADLRNSAGSSIYQYSPAVASETLTPVPSPKASPGAYELAPGIGEGEYGAMRKIDAIAQQLVGGQRRLHLLGSAPSPIQDLGAWPYDET